MNCNAWRIVTPLVGSAASAEHIDTAQHQRVSRPVDLARRPRRRRDIGTVKKQIVTTDDAPSSPLYSQAVRVGSMLYLSGMAGIDVTTKQLAGSTIQDQTRQALRNCAAVVGAAGGTLDDVVQVTVLLADPEDFAGMNEEYQKVFSVDPPARAVAKLGVNLPNLLVSIMMTAHVEG